MRAGVGRAEAAGRFRTKPEATIESRITQDEHGLKTLLTRPCQCLPHERTADAGLLPVSSDRNRREPERWEWRVHPREDHVADNSCIIDRNQGNDAGAVGTKLVDQRGFVCAAKRGANHIANRRLVTWLFRTDDH